MAQIRTRTLYPQSDAQDTIEYRIGQTGEESTVCELNSNSKINTDFLYRDNSCGKSASALPITGITLTLLQTLCKNSKSKSFTLHYNEF